MLTKSLYPISGKDIDDLERGLGKSPLERDLYNTVGSAFDAYAERLRVQIFGSGTGSGKNVLKTHMDGGLLGSLFEAGLRGALTNKPEQNKGLPFDFVGEDANLLSNALFGKSLSAIELKKSAGSAAGKDGGIPKKILNISYGLADGYIPNFADPLSDAIGHEKAAGSSCVTNSSRITQRTHEQG